MDSWEQQEVQHVQLSNSKSARDVLRSAALRMSTKKQLLQDRGGVIDGDEHEKHETKTRQQSDCTRYKASCGNAWVMFTIWRHSFTQIEGMYGSGVRAYLEFLKTMFIMDLLCGIIVAILLILPQSLNYGLTHQVRMITALQSSTEPNAAAAYSCSYAYDAYLVSYINNGSLGTFVQDVLQGTGFLEASPILFIGNYFPDHVSLVSLQYNMPLAYIITLGVVYLFCLVYMLIKTGSSFRESVLSNATRSKEIITHLTLAEWDYSLMNEKNALLAKNMMRNALISELDEQAYRNSTQRSSSCSCCCLWLRRVLVNLLVIGLLGGGGYLIYFCQIFSASYTSSNTSSGSSFDFVQLIFEYLPVIAVGAVGGILPIVFQLLVKLESYRTETAVFVTLLRTTFTSLASLAVFMASVFSVLLCDSKDTCNIGTGTCDKITCWENYIGQEFYKMSLMFFIKLVFMTFVVDFTRAIIGRNCSCALAKLIGPAEFDIPKHVLEAISSQITLWFGVFFCPLLAPITAIVMFLSVYFKKFGCYMSYKPSERPFKATKATTFFMLATFLGFFMCILPVGFMLTQIPASRSCSPFRKNNTIYEIVPGVVSQFPSGVQQFLSILSSPGFLYTVMLVLIIIIYYYATVASAEKQRLDMYEAFLEEEGTKQLLGRLGSESVNVNSAETASKLQQLTLAAAMISTAPVTAAVIADNDKPLTPYPTLTESEVAATIGGAAGAAAAGGAAAAAAAASNVESGSPQQEARSKKINVKSAFQLGLERV